VDVSVRNLLAFRRHAGAKSAETWKQAIRRIQAGETEQTTMNKRRRYRAVLVLGAGFLLIAGACGLWLRSARREEALNGQLIAALVKQDPKQALVLVNAGADPNTPFGPPSLPSLTQLWNRVFHRTALPRNDTYSAFNMVCGAKTFVGDDVVLSYFVDDSHLVETMLQHGAHKNAKDGDGRTPLLWSVVAQHPGTTEVLLKHRVDVNAQDAHGVTALSCVVFTSYAENPHERSKSANLVRQLLAHGADPNLPGIVGKTPLQIADDNNRPDLVALLKQAGAKK
jgi:hypothetical protein